MRWQIALLIILLALVLGAGLKDLMAPDARERVSAEVVCQVLVTGTTLGVLTPASRKSLLSDMILAPELDAGVKRSAERALQGC